MPVAVLLAALLSPKVAAITLWVGLGLLTLTLAALMVTRWGQTQSIAKCAVLSVWAHILLGVYATTVDIVFTPKPGHGGEGTIYIQGVEAVGTSADGSEPGEADGALKPWERFADSDTPRPSGNSASPARAPVEAAKTPERIVAETPTAAAVTAIAPGTLTDTDVQLPQPKPLSMQVAKPRPSAAMAAEPLEPGAPVASVGSAAPATVATPKPGGLPRLADKANAKDSQAYLEDQHDQPSGGTAQRPAAEAVASGSPAGGPSPQTMEALRALLTPGSLASGGSAAGGGNVAPAGPAGGEHELPAMYKLRTSPNRARVAELQGGSADTEAAVKRALAWLAANQSADGRWDASQLESGRENNTLGQNRRGSGTEADSGVTGLALLAFLGAGNTHLRGDHQVTVARGLEFLLRSQGIDGNLAGKADVFAHMYCHGMAALALSEAYAMSGDQRLLAGVRSAVAYTLARQNRTTGGWRYHPRDVGDTSQLGWQLMVLKSAELGGLRIPDVHRELIVHFLSMVTSGTNGGLASYRPGEQISRTMTAESLVCRQFLGIANRKAVGEEAAAYLLEEMPGTSPTNVYYWYYATLSLYQVQGTPWHRWNEALTSTLIATQHRDGNLAGTWDPDAVWGGYGGRVYSTALSALCLEVYYRYLPLHIEAAARDGRTR